MAPSTKRNSARSPDHRTARNTQVYLLSASLLFLSIACSDDPEQHHTTRRDSAGIEIIEIGSGDKHLAWEFEEEFRLGGKDVGPEAFYRVSSYNVQTDSMGRIYIKNDARVSAFAPNGTFLWGAGTEGGGPGELRYPGPIAVSPSGIVGVYDFQGAKIVRFNSEGQVVAPLRLPTGLFGKKIHDGGQTIVFPTRHGSARTEVTEDRLLMVMGEEVTVLSYLNVELREATPPDCGVILWRQPVFSPRIEWTAASGYAAIANTAEYTIDVLDEGARKRIIRRDMPPPAATKAAGMREMGGGITVGMASGRGSTGQRSCGGEALLEARGMAEVMPVIKRMAMAPDGALWVETRKDADGTSIDVFDSSGNYQGTLPQESPFPVIFLPGNKIGAAVRNDDGVDRLAIYRVVIGE